LEICIYECPSFMHPPHPSTAAALLFLLLCSDEKEALD
jgi:hypothetical protein